MNPAAEVETNGFALIQGVLDSERSSLLANAFRAMPEATSMRDDEIYGARNILEIPEIAELARDTEVLGIISKVIGPRPKCVRALFFDKTPRANWPVAWHQDLTLAVRARVNLAGWESWSVKAGVDHVQPPPTILEQMVSLRLHLDECGADNGPLKVLPGTHRQGRIRSSEIRNLREQIGETICSAPFGSGLLMKPLLLHASSAARKPHHRRVIHLEFAPVELLPGPLKWFQA